MFKEYLGVDLVARIELVRSVEQVRWDTLLYRLYRRVRQLHIAVALHEYLKPGHSGRFRWQVRTILQNKTKNNKKQKKGAQDLALEVSAGASEACPCQVQLARGLRTDNIIGTPCEMLKKSWVKKSIVSEFK